jgi:hypothetical protein
VTKVPVLLLYEFRCLRSGPSLLRDGPYNASE